ncbi:hypothetical protein [Chelatococcus sp.]|uniref:hypothetical protein n=1 Tax=Chelatococcus sp. TaxID=1953771 RepID=UPI0025C5AE3A|nr:hypothetical protein [Chelatococcus sp.]MBX3559202.1 hypothetical protein [Chelatococcus sp.]
MTSNKEQVESPAATGEETQTLPCASMAQNLIPLSTYKRAYHAEIGKLLRQAADAVGEKRSLSELIDTMIDLKRDNEKLMFCYWGPIPIECAWSAFICNVPEYTSPLADGRPVEGRGATPEIAARNLMAALATSHPKNSRAQTKPAKRGNVMAGWGDESEFLSVGSEIDAFF